MSKKEPELREKIETIVSEWPETEIRVRCSSSTLKVPKELPQSEIGRNIADVAGLIPDYVGLAETKVEAKYEITIMDREGKTEQCVTLSDRELMRVFKTVRKVMVQGRGGGYGPRALAVDPLMGDLVD